MGTLHHQPAWHTASSQFPSACPRALPPAPTYPPQADPWDKSKIGTHSPSHACTSSFGGGGGGRGAQSVGSMAGQGQGQLQLDALLFGPAGAGGSGGAPGSEGPGPGAYELQDFGSIKQGLHRQAHRPSPAFQQSHLDTRPDRCGEAGRHTAPTVGPRSAVHNRREEGREWWDSADTYGVYYVHGRDAKRKQQAERLAPHHARMPVRSRGCERPCRAQSCCW